MNTSIRRFARRAFTLVEVLVVISIFVLLLAIAVPAFSSMLYTSEQSLAENSLKLALGAARDVAARSPAGQDAAAVFIYDKESKKVTTLIATRVGALQDELFDAAGNQYFGNREIFAAAEGLEPLQMTSGWSVRGFAPANTIDTEWYEQTYQGLESQGNWVYPETDFYDEPRPLSGDNRQTFLVRFEGGTGIVKAPDPTAVLVFFPSTSSVGRTVGSRLNPESDADPVRFVRRILASPTTGANGVSLQAKRDILGAHSRDSILCKSVGQVALCSEHRLAKALQVTLNRDTGSLYEDLPQPQFITNVDPDLVNAWIEDRLTNTDGSVDSDCRIFTIQRYLGWLQEVTGTRNGLGVGS